MPLLPSKTKEFICIACEDTRKNSKGGVCSPCEARDRVKEKVKVVERVRVETTRKILVSAPSLWNS